VSPAKTSDSPTEIATLRIELKHTRPPIWRKIEAPTSITLKDLHDIVQGKRCSDPTLRRVMESLDAGRPG